MKRVETNVSLERAERLKTKTEERESQGGEAAAGDAKGEARTTTSESERPGNDDLMERVVASDNVEKASKRVQQNKGSPGIDGMRVEELPAWLAKNWGAVRAKVLDGTYQPKPVQEREIPKDTVGIRKLGIPTVIDRFIQQCVLQVLQPLFDPTFSQHSHGFRPGRSAHDALRAAATYIREGRRWVVDIDLESFFDRVNHDVLMGRLAKRIQDKRMLRLLRSYLNAGIMVEGVVMARDSGTPQGGPMSPLLANVLLDEVDKELEKRGHAFVRYADDCNIYVRSETAGKRVMAATMKLFENLQLRVNESKSGVAAVTERKFLGYSFNISGEEVSFVAAPKALERLKDRVRALTGRAGGRSIQKVIGELAQYLRGWKQYFRLVEPVEFTSLDGWMRRRLRALQLKQWKTPRTIEREMERRGVSERDGRRVNAHRTRYWAMATHKGMHAAMPNRYFDAAGLPRLSA